MQGARRQARIIALQALYEIDCANHAVADVLGQRVKDGSITDGVRPFVYELVNGVVESRERLDELIQRYAPEWPVDQMAIVDRNILRIAIYEIVISTATPLRVVINEAVELAKAYGSDTSPRFVNGVLGSLAANEPAVRAVASGDDMGTDA